MGVLPRLSGVAALLPAAFRVALTSCHSLSPHLSPHLHPIHQIRVWVLNPGLHVTRLVLGLQPTPNVGYSAAVHVVGVVLFDDVLDAVPHLGPRPPVLLVVKARVASSSLEGWSDAITRPLGEQGWLLIIIM